MTHHSSVRKNLLLSLLAVGSLGHLGFASVEKGVLCGWSELTYIADVSDTHDVLDLVSDIALGLVLAL